MLPGGRGLLDTHVANVLLQRDDPRLLAAHHVLQGLDLLQQLLQRALRLLQEERETGGRRSHIQSCVIH